MTWHKTNIDTSILIVLTIDTVLMLALWKKNKLAVQYKLDTIKKYDPLL